MPNRYQKPISKETAKVKGVPNFQFPQCADAPLEKIKMVVYVLGGRFISAQKLVDQIKNFIPSAQLTFEPDMALAETIKALSKPVDDRHAREEFGWENQYPIGRTIEDFIKELRENPEMYE